MLDGQDLLSWIAAIGGVGGIVAAIFSILGYRSRHGGPDFLPEVREYANCQYVKIQQLDEGHSHWWLICSVRLARLRGKRIADVGKALRDANGQVVGYSQDGEWCKKITYSQPSGSQKLLVHPTVEGPLVLWLTVCLQANTYVKRRIKRTVFPSRI